MLVETKDFTELDIIQVKKILGSSELEITSEVEVVEAASLWLSYKSEERRKFVKDVITKVRFSLLSDHFLKHLSSKISLPSIKAILKDMLEKKNSICNYKPNSYVANRYCSRSTFNVLVCGGYKPISFNTVSDVYQIDGSNLKSVNILSSMKETRVCHKAVYVKGNVFVFAGYCDDNDNSTKFLERYSLSTKTWDIVAELFDNRQNFSTCAFMDKIFIMGGSKVLPLNSCLQFDTKRNKFKWKEVAAMDEERTNSACAVFEGKIVVSGGCNDEELRSVESYDVMKNSWSAMPNMIGSKSDHSLVVVKNQLFAIGAYTDRCEVFDKGSNQFVALKSPNLKIKVISDNFIAVGTKIFLINDYGNSINAYDVENNEWFHESSEISEYLQDFACVKIPYYQT